ncbi:FMN-linked oxidoreductase [Athelia psychrophila]|uniref:FMN-linked oxidoreductase n=1 Tax=Athelia psychrophila TaxID=1759441 RepID=A0A166FKQ2_9AGAM|nr:FMN-linked oxidoreductase [Fibularhizoctonia sp. CBS 109695]
MSIPDIENIAATGVAYFTPAQNPSSGTAIVPQPSGKDVPLLFKPLTIRGVTFQNRIFLSPLCQYSAEDGHLTAWHQAHLGGIFTRGPGLTILEATAVVSEGRITPQDSGLWADSQIAPLKAIADFAHSQGQKVGIQLAHAGRKASCIAPWLSGAAVATAAVGGWPENVYGPSAIQWGKGYAHPKEASVEYIKSVVAAFAASAKRAVQAGIDVIEIHNAHGYLAQSFLSPVSNKRTDQYGGSFENRTRLTLELVDAVRAVIPQDMPLFLRISASDWLEESLPNEPSWTSADTVRLAPILAAHGVDFLDVSSGGNHPLQKIKGTSTSPYQAHFSAAVKEAVGDTLLVGAVGGITSGAAAQAVLEGGADVALVGRSFQKNPALVWAFAEELGVDIFVAHQIEWGFKGRGKERSAQETKL